jgi:hypothetical protein
MRAAWIVPAALVIGAVLPGPARAGVYNTAEPWPQPRPFEQFQLEWAGYRLAPVDRENRVAGAVWLVTAEACPQAPGLPLRLPLAVHTQSAFGLLSQDSPGLKYLRRIAELEAKERQGLLSLEERINLGAYYIRMQDSRNAIRVLEAAGLGQRHFMLRANLAAAYEQAGIPERAISYRQQALLDWPTMYPGWDSFQLNFYRKAEKLQLTLAQLRQEEARLQPNRGGLRLDNLFPRVQFVGPDGKYEVGGIAPAQWGELPSDATPLLEQLVLWSPFDERLQWLLAEVLNANGNPVAAAIMLKPLVNKQQDPAKWSSVAPPELREHYRALAHCPDFSEAYKNQYRADPTLPAQLLCALAPRPGGLGAADLIREAGWPAWAMRYGAPIDPAGGPPRATGGDTTATDTATPSSASWVPNWRQLGVGFGAGVLVTLLLSMQLKQAGRPKG